MAAIGTIKLLMVVFSRQRLADRIDGESDMMQRTARGLVAPPIHELFWRR
jgi:hypothetical protein